MTFLIAQSTGLGGLFSALGLNVQAFVLDLIAFIITCYIVGRYVFPPMARALDAKRNELEAAARAEQDAQKALDAAKHQADGIVVKARAAADEIMQAAKADASAQLAEARSKATKQGERIIAEAHEQLSKDVMTARKQLESETARLVADATERLLGEKLDTNRDKALIERSLEMH